MRSAAGILAAGTLSAAALLGINALARSGLQPESQLFGPTLVSGNDPREWALTYDDGPNPRSTPELLDVLAQHNVRATFFMIGRFVREQAPLVRRIQAAGHLVGNHTMHHCFLATRPVSVARREILKCNAVLEDVLGVPVRYFRAPYGSRRPAILRFVREQNMVPVQWNAQGNDWDPIGPAGILRRLQGDLDRTRRQGRGANVLLHDGFDQQQGYDRTQTVQATAALLERAAREGIRLVTVDAWG